MAGNYKELLSGTMRDLLGQVNRECQDIGGNLVAMIFQVQRETHYEFMVAANSSFNEEQQKIVTETFIAAAIEATHKLMALQTPKPS